MAANQQDSMTVLRGIARRAMIANGLAPDFSPEALAQLNAIKAPVAAPGPGIRDLRDRLWCSIDNDDSRDLDQLSVAEPLSGDAVKILVAIADVDSTVALGSAIDGHARSNTTSVYTAAQIFPMLPERLSTDLTSLGENQLRVAIVIEMVVATDGTVTASDVYRALVLNRAKLAYNSVAAWLDGTGPMPAAVAAAPGVDAQLRLQDRVAQQLRQLRHQRGALNLESIEAVAVFADGVLRDLNPDQKNRATELIEDFMIAANAVTAKFLDHKGLPSLRRVLRSPERWSRIVALATANGERLPAEPSGVALAAFLDKRRKADPATFPDLSLSVIKMLGSGEYALELPGQPVTGHFALAVSDYTHSTAPNRRFPDLITQRLIKAGLDGRAAPYTVDELRELADRCTAMEDSAAKVERSVRKSAAAMLLASRVGQKFQGIVTGVSDKGTWVRICQPVAEGRIVKGFAGLDVGDRVTVQLVDTNVERGFVDFAKAS
jgi:exoribonuclease II